jgi:hypothetical protein
MRTREGANGDQIAQGLAPSSLHPMLKGEAWGQDIGGTRPFSPPGPSLNLSWRGGPGGQFPERGGWRWGESVEA